MRRPGRLVGMVVGVAAVVLGAWLLLGETGPTGAPEPPVPAGGGAEPGDGAPLLGGRGDRPLPSDLPRPEAQAGQPPGPPAGPAVVAEGVVVDDLRRPVEGAEVVATIAGSETGRLRTGPDGRFEVALGPRPLASAELLFGSLEVHKDGRGAWRNAYLGPDVGERIDYGPVVLADLHLLTVRVLRDGVPVAGAEVVVGNGRTALYAPAPALRSVRADAAGLARFEGVHGPMTWIYAVADGRGRAAREVRLPATGVVDLELPPDRRATILVKHGVTGAPVAGAEVSLGGGGTLPMPQGLGCLPPLPDLRTDGEGKVVATGLPPGSVGVVARAPGLGMRFQGFALPVFPVTLGPADTEATVTLWPYRSVRFPIAETGAGAPADGTELEVRRYQPTVGYDVGQPRGRVEDRHVVLEPFPPGPDWGHVVAPDGRWAQWRAPWDKDLGEPVEFGWIRDLCVRLLWRDGTPAVGELLWAILQPRGKGSPERTDANGEVVFARCVAESAHVMWTAVDGGFGQALGSVSLADGPRVVTFTIDRPVDVALRLRVGGLPRIPPGLEVRVPDLDPDQTGGDRPVDRDLREDPETAEVAFRWLPMPGGEAPPVTLRAEGLPEVVVTPSREGDGVWRAVVDFAPGATLKVRVTPPEGGRYHLKLERWDEAGGRWTFRHDDPGYQAGLRAVDGVHTFVGLASGRYRWTEHYTNRSSDPVELRGGEVVEVTFDLTSLVVVKGRVEVPAGENPAYVSVRAEGRERGDVSATNPAHVRADGTFEFRAASGERLVLVGRHPLLRPIGEPVAITVGSEEPVLHFGPGPHVVFRLEGSDLTTAEPDSRMFPPWLSPVQVLARKPGGWTAEGPSSPAIAKGGLCRAGVPGPGRWTLRIAQSGFVPIDLEDVEVGMGGTDLGTLRPSPGATLTVRLRPGEGGLPPSVSVAAERQGERPYTAWGSQVAAGDPPTVTLRGLGAGRFRVVVRATFGRGEPLGEATVESDGAGPLVVDVNLR